MHTGRTGRQFHIFEEIFVSIASRDERIVVDRLPEGWSFAAHINPFFYMIDGIRYGMTGHADGSVLAGVLVLGGVDLVLGIACWMVLNRGWKLKA